jgi:ABC-type branched-subunit amino acid transport system substrate-binding protein
MLSDGCSAIIGFEYLSDLLLVLKEQTKTDVPIFTPFASTENTDDLPKNVFVFMPSYKYLATKMFAFLSSKFGTINDVLLVTEINRDEMKDYKAAYSQLLNEHHIKFSSFDFLEDDSDMGNKLKKLLKQNKQYKYIFLFTTSVDGSNIIDLTRQQNPVYIGTEYFGSSTYQSLLTRLKVKNIRAYIIRNLDFIKSNTALTAYEQAYYDKFHVAPTILSAYAYDATNIILKALHDKGKINTNTIYDIKFNGITGVSVKNNQFNRSESTVILSITDKGYQYEQ